VFVVLHCDDVAMRQMDLYTLTQSASVRLMATTMLNLFLRLSVMLKHWRRAKVTINTVTTIVVHIANQLCICISIVRV